MFKQLFGHKPEDGETNGQAPGSHKSENGANGTESPAHRAWEVAVSRERSNETESNRKLPAKTNQPPETITLLRANLESFEEIYRNAPVKPPKVAYSSLGILRVIDMVHSPHLDGMSIESKRNAVLMTLEAVGVKAEDLLQDAMVRQRALNDYEEVQQRKLKELENAKAKENALIRAELDRLSAAHLARIQSNMEELARGQEHLRQWTERKEEESQQIAEAATFCAPQNSSPAGILTATVTRFGADAVVGKSDAAAGGKR
jgi:hypothetical protein